MNSPDNPSTSPDEESQLSPEDRLILVEMLSQHDRKTVIRRRNSVLADLDGAPFAAVTLRDSHDRTNPLLVCSKNPGVTTDVVLTVSGSEHQLQEIPGTLVCNRRINEKSDPAAGTEGREVSDGFEMPTELTFELRIDEIPDHIRLTAGEVRALPDCELPETSAEGIWSELQSWLPQPPEKESPRPEGRSGSRTSSYVLNADGGAHSKAFLTATDSGHKFSVELTHDGYRQAVFSPDLDVPVVAEVHYEVDAGIRRYCYLFDPRGARRSEASRVVTRKFRLNRPDNPTSAMVGLHVRPMAAADVPLLDWDQRHRWLPDPPMAALTVRGLTGSSYRLTMFDFDMDDIRKSPNCALVMRRMSTEGGVG